MPDINGLRNFLKAAPDWPDDFQTDQMKKLPHPPIEKPFPADARLIELPALDSFDYNISLFEALKNRRSRRVYNDQSLTIKELAFLLWSTHGIDKIVRDGQASLRTVPSGGARHPFETYLWINRVEGLEKGIYRYLPVEHKLMYIYSEEGMEEKMTDGCLEQHMAGKAAVTFIWSAIPYRSEWRYYDAAHKPLLLDGGHICQNLYLACEAIKAGTCAIAAYDQEKMDKITRVDGNDEFVVYVAPVGKY